MTTMDVRIKVTVDIMEDSDNFCEKADNELQNDLIKM